MKFAGSQIDKLSDIASDIGLVFLASVVLPTILDKPNFLAMIFGSVTMLVFWFISLLLLKMR